MKTIAFAPALSAAVLTAASPAFAGNIYLLTVPIKVTGLKAGTTINVSCSAASGDEVKGSDANSTAAALDANPPKGAAKVAVVVGTGPADAIVPLVIEPKSVEGKFTGSPGKYQCWSDYGGYVTGDLTAGSGTVTASDSWSVVK